MARAVDVSPSTVTRWVKGKVELPGYILAVTELALRLTQNGVSLPDAFLRHRGRVSAEMADHTERAVEPPP